MFERPTRARSNPLLAPCLALVFSCASGQAGADVRKGFEVAPHVQVALADGWRALPQTTRNLIELQREQSGKQTARVSVSSEPRKDHDDAVRRLGQIAAERAGDRTFTVICGWPALERIARVPLARPEQDSSDAGKPFQAGDASAETVTVAIAVGDQIVRFEGQVSAGAPAAELVQLARSASCPVNPDAAANSKAIDSLKQAPR